jgi:tetratricopeptide (TPR) repeat protein
MAQAYFASGDVDAFLAEAETAIALNPNHATTLGAMANLMIFSDRLDRGIALMNKSIALNPRFPNWIYFGLSFYHYRKGDYESALEAGLKIEWLAFHWTYLYRAAAYGQLGRIEEAEAAAAKLLEIYPDYADKAWEDFQIHNITDEALAHFAEGLSKAGLDIRTTPPEPTN